MRCLFNPEISRLKVLRLMAVISNNFEKLQWTFYAMTAINAVIALIIKATADNTANHHI